MSEIHQIYVTLFLNVPRVKAIFLKVALNPKNVFLKFFKSFRVFQNFRNKIYLWVFQVIAANDMQQKFAP